MAHAGDGDRDRLTNLYKPFVRQEDFHKSHAKYRLFGGAAGPGKTKALLWEAIKKAEDHPGCDTLLLRRTYPELESSLLAQFRRDVPRWSYISYNEAKHLVTWENGSTTRFGYCRNENDVYQYQGAEYLFIGIDELTHFTLKQWQFLTSRNRCPIPGSVPCMAGATNPGNIGHAWVKALWVDKVAPAGYERPEQYDAADYDFIPARIADNPIYAEDMNYRKTLGALPERLRKAFLEGDWTVLEGQYFDVFEIGRHTGRAEEIGMQAWWPRWISIDWGFQHPSAVYWHCGVPELDIRYRLSDIRKPGASGERGEEGLRSFGPARGAGSQDDRMPGDREGPQGYGTQQDGRGPRIVTYREFVKSGLSPRMLGQAIAERTAGDRIAEVFLSPDAFAHRTSEASIAEQLGEVLAQNGLPRPTPADDDRVGGWQLMYQMLENDEWVITENCRELIEGLPLLMRDDRRVEDARKMDGDDAADAARYGLVSGVRYAGIGAHGRAPGAGESPPNNGMGSGARFVPGVPVGMQIERQISAEDPTSRAIHRQRLEAEAKKQLGAHRFGKRRWKW
jgi:Terminase large subunit, T4likevirus-type, N-terminal